MTQRELSVIQARKPLMCSFSGPQLGGDSVVVIVPSVRACCGWCRHHTVNEASQGDGQHASLQPQEAAVARFLCRLEMVLVVPVVRWQRVPDAAAISPEVSLPYLRPLAYQRRLAPYHFGLPMQGPPGPVVVLNLAQERLTVATAAC